MGAGALPPRSCGQGHPGSPRGSQSGDPRSAAPAPAGKSRERRILPGTSRAGEPGGGAAPTLRPVRGPHRGAGSRPQLRPVPFPRPGRPPTPLGLVGPLSGPEGTSPAPPPPRGGLPEPTEAPRAATPWEPFLEEVFGRATRNLSPSFPAPLTAGFQRPLLVVLGSASIYQSAL